MCTAMCETDGCWGPAVQCRELSSVLCGDLDGQDGGAGRKEVPEGDDTCIYVSS